MPASILKKVAVFGLGGTLYQVDTPFANRNIAQGRRRLNQAFVNHNENIVNRNRVDLGPSQCE